ncbi:MAG: sensor histidine kinase [Bryobacteraceae bacterium]
MADESRRLLEEFTHDCNNLLAEILGHASLLEALSDPGGEMHESVRAIRQAAERAAGLVERLRSRGRAEAAPVDLNETIVEVAGLLRGSRGIRIRRELHAGNATIRGDPGRLHQMLLNLALNARDAMPQGGELVFRSYNHAGFVVVEICDTGPGIPDESLDRLFDPSFTTKPGGVGGLGLAIVASIAADHHGSVDVESRPGYGATFRVRFPAYSPGPPG